MEKVSGAIRALDKGLADCLGLINPFNLGKTYSANGFIPSSTNITSLTFAGTYVHDISNI